MPQTLSQIKAMLAERGLHPRHRFGQNFLHDPRKLSDIVEAADVKPGDVVLEVGPGTGTLTEALLERGARVIAVEIDRDLCALLRDRLGSIDGFTLIEADVMDGKHALNPLVLAAIDDRSSAVPFTLIANLPYNVASPLIAVLAMDHPGMRSAIVMVQREVADRLMAPPGGKDYGSLSIVVQAMCTLERVATLSPGCFWPQPKIDSAVVKLARRPVPLTRDPHALARMTQTLFTKRRKQLGAILGRDFAFPPDISPNARPEQLSVEQIVRLATIAPVRPDPA